MQDFAVLKMVVGPMTRCFTDHNARVVWSNSNANKKLYLITHGIWEILNLMASSFSVNHSYFLKSSLSSLLSLPLCLICGGPWFRNLGRFVCTTVYHTTTWYLPVHPKATCRPS